MRELGRQAILPHPQSLSGPAGSYRDAQCSGFGGKEIRNCGRVYAWDPSLRKHRNGGTAVALIPFCPGALVENPRCGVIQRGFEFVVTAILLEGLNVLIRGVSHRIGQKAYSEFQRFFRGAKTEDAFRNSQKFVGVDHCSLPCEVRSRFPISTGTPSSLTPVAALSCIEAVKKVAAMWFDDTFKGAIIAVRGHCV